MIGDMYRVEQRGTALGIVQAVRVRLFIFLYASFLNCVVLGEFSRIRIGYPSGRYAKFPHSTPPLTFPT